MELVALKQLRILVKYLLGHKELSEKAGEVVSECLRGSFKMCSGSFGWIH